MKGLSAGLTFLNFSTVFALLLGIVGRGLGYGSALIAVVLGIAVAFAAYLQTFDPDQRPKIPDPPKVETRLSKRAERRPQKTAVEPIPAPSTPTRKRYSSLLFWILAACFAIFAVRSFCWLLYVAGDQLKIQSSNNLGDLALHITYIRNFAHGVALWPENPIYAFSNLRYPAGVDLFNAILSLLHIDLIRGLVWVGLLASLATFYALYRWGGTFGIAGFLFNGGLAGFQFVNTLQFIDYQDRLGDRAIAWKSIPLSMFVTQRGLLYAIPAGLLLLWLWRKKFFGAVAGVGDPGSTAVTEAGDDAQVGGRADRRLRGQPPLPFWIEVSLYASMPLFHMHTFLALTIVLVFLFFLGDAQMRGHIATVVATAFIPATFFVWLITDHFQASSVLEWQPGWVQNKGDFAMGFFRFWAINFGLWAPLAVLLVALCGWQGWKNGARLGKKLPEDLAFLLPAVAIFIIGMLFKTAPWEWDNLKLMMWAYFLALPYFWTHLIQHWPVPVRIAVCVALFGSGFVTLCGGLANGRAGGGFGFANRTEVDAVGIFTRDLPAEARFAAYPVYNHPLLLQGRKVVLGYPGHLWTQGFEYSDADKRLRNLMEGKKDWREEARRLRVRYIFWGREEKMNYPMSARPWEKQLTPLNGDAVELMNRWGAIYDLEQMKR